MTFVSAIAPLAIPPRAIIADRVTLPTSAIRSRIAAQARALVTPGPRLLDEVECILSVLLAILFAHLLGARNVSWAAFSGYMVMRSHLSESLTRGALRIVGTGLGAAIALIVIPIAARSTPLASIAAALIGGASLYGALTGKRAYAWLFVGLTFEMILLDSIEHPGRILNEFAETRLLEVVAGTAACLIVNLISQVSARRRWPAGTSPAPQLPGGWHPHAARHAGQAALALALLPWLWSWARIPELAQSAVTIMAVMLVPISSMGAGGFATVSRRIIHRIAGCLAGAMLAGAVLLIAQGNPSVLIAGTMLGVLLGRHIENGKTGLAYIGTQFTLAILVTLVPDSYADAAMAPAWDRLVGILIGMALLEPVLFAWHLLRPGARGHAATSTGSLDA
ncbi:MAG: FUSC family protein [Candidatus Sphingomonas colombiensis]|nr:FUSC family protein [Sphingomonas sp.]WEK43888.1 MAG: FUSC family protein [Sphingomonas sp.]